jgi:hypothetical protein
MTSPFGAGVPDVTNAPVRTPGDGQTGTFYRPQLSGQGGASGLGGGGNAGPLTVIIRGAVFDGRMLSLTRRLLSELKTVVGNQGLADVQLNLDKSIRNPTPYYETQVTVQNVGTDRVVHDRGIVYGPWLEGTSSRNQSTRFKGYASFRRAADALRRKVVPLTAPIVARYTAMMNS